MMIKISKDCVSGVFFLVIGTYMRIQIHDSSSLAFIVPYIYSWIMIIGSLGLIIRGFLRWRNNENELIVISIKDIKGLKDSKELQIILYILMILVYYICIIFIGMVVSSVAFVSLTYLFLEVKSIKIHLISQIFFILIYIIFSSALGVKFPHGFLY